MVFKSELDKRASKLNNTKLEIAEMVRKKNSLKKTCNRDVVFFTESGVIFGGLTKKLSLQRREGEA